MDGIVQNSKRTSVDLKIQGDVAELRLVPPEEKPPTLDLRVLEDLDNRIEEIEQSTARITYLTSASEKFFCVGANIEVLKETNTETIGPWIRNGHKVLNRLEDLSCPVVAVVLGYAMGGGLELAMAADLIFADDSSRFAQSEARLGFIPGWGGCRRLVDRVGVAKAKYLFYSSTMLNGNSALECGLVDFAGTRDELDEFRKDFTRNVLENNYHAIATFKRIVNGEMKDQRERNIETETVNSVGCVKDEDTLRRLDAFLNKGGKK